MFLFFKKEELNQKQLETEIVHKSLPTETAAYWAMHLYGNQTIELPLDKFSELYDELQNSDPDHPDVSITHESQWCLGAFKSQKIIWENVETGTPRHMKNIPKEKVIVLWTCLANGEIDKIEKEDWKDGYG